VHGANRLASNSLLEGLVFAARIGRSLARSLPPAAPAVPPRPSSSGLLDPAERDALSAAMSTGVGALRSGAGLAAAGNRLDALAAALGDTRPAPDSWEATDLLTVARALTLAATVRQETRGCHWREDHPGTEEAWRVHLDVRLDADGGLESDRRPVGNPVVQPWCAIRWTWPGPGWPRRGSPNWWSGPSPRTSPAAARCRARPIWRSVTT
jgi:L-aspartate oxidase